MILLRAVMRKPNFLTISNSGLLFIHLTFSTLPNLWKDSDVFWIVSGMKLFALLQGSCLAIKKDRNYEKPRLDCVCIVENGYSGVLFLSPE